MDSMEVGHTPFHHPVLKSSCQMEIISNNIPPRRQREKNSKDIIRTLASQQLMLKCQYTIEYLQAWDY
jgi:hypothetical protein